ncbi:hypothetical protein LBMAG42_49040 [Deltaproteobacteria bacterium]|nr:hypothetical protein LBMAG42_49040 [Deltaproteobacteria bacterium]
MSDERTEVPGWGIPVEAQASVLLAEARRLVNDGDLEGAVGIAEELLDHDPGDLDALLLVADVAPRYGHGEVGVLAAQQVRRLGAEVGAIEAAALFAACEFEAALEAADTCLAGAPADARAHAVRGQVLEVLGRLPEADEALAAAHALRPEAYPLPLPVADADWEPLLMEALGRLEPEDREAVRRWTVVWHPAPDPALLTSSHPPIPPSTIAVVSVADGEELVCSVFTRNLARGCATEGEVIARLSRALGEEAAQLEE